MVLGMNLIFFSFHLLSISFIWFLLSISTYVMFRCLMKLKLLFLHAKLSLPLCELIRLQYDKTDKYQLRSFTHLIQLWWIVSVQTALALDYYKPLIDNASNQVEFVVCTTTFQHLHHIVDYNVGSYAEIKL